jgi:FimV-like protein
MAIPCHLFALGLGEIRVFSHLNEPFRAEIPLIDANRIYPNSIKVDFAREEEFARLGLTRDPNLLLLQLQVLRNQDGRMVVAIESSERMQSPYLELLIDLAWPDGQLYRAFTVLLDPPDDVTSEHAFEHPAVKKSVSTMMVLNQPPSLSEHTDETHPSVQPQTYGPTLVDENIWQISKRYQTGSMTLPQVVLSIVGTNPEAFEAGNLNGLKTGARLQIPKAQDIEQVPVSHAAEEVEVHDVAWRTHQQIQHVLPPPYIQRIQADVSTLPSVPVFKPQAVQVQSKQQEQDSQKTWVLQELESRLKSLEQHTGDLSTTLKTREQENFGLKKTIEDLKRQLENLKLKLWEKQRELAPIIWMDYLLALCVLILSWLYWTKKRPSDSSKTELPVSSTPESTDPSEVIPSDSPEILESNSEASEGPELAEPDRDEHESSAHGDFVLPTDSARWKKVLEEKASTWVQDHEPHAPVERESGVESETESTMYPMIETPMTLPHLLKEPESLVVTPSHSRIKSSHALAALLQLAKNYYSQGDLLAAKQALEEVKEFGNEQQKAESELLIAQIDASNHDF